MVAGFYDEMAATAAGMIAEFGQAVTVTRIDPGSYETRTGRSKPHRHPRELRRQCL